MADTQNKPFTQVDFLRHFINAGAKPETIRSALAIVAPSRVTPAAKPAPRP